jgi:hypothetical protein
MNRKTRMAVAGLVTVLTATIGGAAVADSGGVEQARHAYCC